MRTLVRIATVAAVSTWAAAGCGSISATSDGSGTAGATGAAGVTGASGTTGAAGVTGSAGTGGTTGAAGSGGTSAPCPDRVPNDGGTCAREGLQCEYGDDPRGDACRTRAICTSSRWQVTAPDSNSCPSIDYGTCAKGAGSACSPQGSYCVQPNGADCQCTTCSPTAPVCAVGTTPTLYCNTNTTAGCPAGEPNLGTACSATDGQECTYCPDSSRVCSHGIWVAGNACIRPV